MTIRIDPGLVTKIKSEKNCTLDQAHREATKITFVQEASKIDSVKDCRRFLMALCERLG